MLSILILVHSVSDQSILFHEKYWIIFYQVHYLAQAMLDAVNLALTFDPTPQKRKKILISFLIPSFHFC
jgi:hypothetical protein